MYVTTTVYIGDDEYEVGAEVGVDNCGYSGMSYTVGEPDISAPNCPLELSRAVFDPQDPECPLPEGWSAMLEEKLIEAMCDRDIPSGLDPDEYHDR